MTTRKITATSNHTPHTDPDPSAPPSLATPTETDMTVRHSAAEIPLIPIEDALLMDVRSGIKQVAILHGRRYLPLGQATLITRESAITVPVYLRQLTFARLRDVSEEDCLADGHSTPGGVLESLRGLDPALTLEDEVTVAHFHRVDE